ncbi:hypothetical protein [Vulcanisaeta distributa]|uniref:hypothetical protein n=1 Tax=Vulcanisaeta distributa TaxID=164451 RepID=UPI0006CFF51E|nr:hypothetical protein [Vulcanisaeta distributa]
MFISGFNPVLADCSVPLNVNFISTGFPYVVTIYSVSGMSAVNAGIGDVGRTFFITEGKAVDLSFVNETIHYVSPIPPFFYAAELTAGWNMLYIRKTPLSTWPFPNQGLG